LISEMNILISLIGLPGFTCAQPLCQPPDLSQPAVVCSASDTMVCGENEIGRKLEINDNLFLNLLNIQVVAGVPTVFFTLELLDYQIEHIDYDSYCFDDSFSVRSPRADYNSSGRVDASSSLAALNGDAKELILVIKPLQLLNLLAEEDVTIYEAADILRISVHTANKYVAKIKSEFGVLTLPAAVLYAARQGLISKPVDKVI